MKKTIIIFGLIVLFFLAGCHFGEEQSLLKYEFKKGFSEIDIELLENRPPDEVYEQNRFTIGVKAANNGAYDADAVGIEIVGFNDKYVHLPINRINLQGFKGKSFDHPSGEVRVETLEAVTGTIPIGSEGELQKYFIIAEYDYRTELVEDVCINPSLYDVYDSGCTMEDIATNGQGSPLAITEIKKPIYQNPKVELRMTVENRGNGKVKEATITQARLGAKQLNCQFRGGINQKTFNFEEKNVQRAEIVCQREFDIRKSFQTPLYVGLDFTYQLEIIDQILIKK